MGRKWNQDVTPAERLLFVYTMLLFSGREMSLTELARRLDCSKQTVRRLIDQLEASRFGTLLREMHGREVAYRLERPRNLPKLSLDPEGLRQLALCRAFLMHLLPESMRRTVDATLQKASAYLPEGAEPCGIEEVGCAFAKGPIDYTPFQETLRELMEAIRLHRVCEVSYRATLQGEVKRHCFAPVKIVAYHEALYARGWLVSEKGRAGALFSSPTSLAVHRMTGARMTRRNAESLPGDADALEGCFGLMGEEPFTVRVRFAPSAATYASERTWSRDQKITRHKDGSVTLTMTARSEAEVIAWVMSFADTAEVLSPAALRKAVACRVRAMNAVYARKSGRGQGRRGKHAESAGGEEFRAERPFSSEKPVSAAYAAQQEEPRSSRKEPSSGPSEEAPGSSGMIFSAGAEGGAFRGD